MIVSHSNIKFQKCNKQNKMNDISVDRLKKMNRDAGNSYFLQHINKSISQNRRQLAKSIYNLQSRNIRQFTKEWVGFRRKLNQQQANTSKPITSIKRNKFGRTLRYQQDQLLQFQFPPELQSKQPNKNDTIFAPIKTNTSFQGKSSSQPTIKNVTKKLKINFDESSISPRQKLISLREKSQTMIRENRQRRITLRQRMATQWQVPHQKYVNSRLTNNRYQKSLQSNQKYLKQQALIDLNREKMLRFILNLHRLEWSYQFIKTHQEMNQESLAYKDYMKEFKFDQDSPINEHAINYMIQRRYQLQNHHLEDVYQQKEKQLNQDEASRKKSKFISAKEYELLHSLSKNSILRIMNKRIHTDDKTQQSDNPYKLQNINTKKNNDQKVYFNLPYAEFISFRQTKTSLYRLCSMNIKVTYKIAFMLFDKNRNGLIDQQDLMQMISLSRTLTILERDINVIAKAMLSQERKSPRRFVLNSLKQKNKKQKQSDNFSQATDSAEQKNYSKKSDNNTFISPIKQQNASQSDNEQLQNGLASSRFSIQKLYTFLKEKEMSPRQQNNNLYPKTIRPLSFTDFCSAFRNQRPFIIYDFMIYIFNAQFQDFSNSIQKQLSKYKKQKQTQISETININAKQQTIEQKWNKRLKQSNQILTLLVRSKDKLLF